MVKFTQLKYKAVNLTLQGRLATNFTKIFVFFTETNYFKVERPVLMSCLHVR